MARVTVEDCVLQVPNRFELVMLSAHRARALGSGAELKLSRDRDKNPVVALREIAEQKLDMGALEESLVKSLQKRIEPEVPEEEVAELMAGEQQSWVNALEGSPDADESDSDADLEGDELDGDDEGEGGAPSEEGAADDFGSGFEDAEIKD